MGEDSTSCVACHRSISFIQDSHGMPDEAVIFSSSGNYGSRVWDEMYRTIVIYLCDTCLRAAGNDGRVVEVERVPRPESRYVAWSPNEELE